MATTKRQKPVARPVEPNTEAGPSAADRLKALAEREMAERITACAAAVNAVLSEHGFALDPVISFGVNGVVGAKVGFVATR